MSSLVLCGDEYLVCEYFDPDCCLVGECLLDELDYEDYPWTLEEAFDDDYIF